MFFPHLLLFLLFSLCAWNRVFVSLSDRRMPLYRSYKIFLLLSLLYLLQEVDDYYGSSDSKRASLLMMNFTVDEVDFAIDKLG